MVFRSYPSSIKAVGFKAHYGQLEAFPPALDLLRLDPELVVIHVRRHNLLAVEASRKRAQTTGVRLVSATNTEVDDTTVTLDVTSMFQQFERYQSQRDWTQVHMPAARVFQVTYEELVENAGAALSPVCLKLGLPHDSLVSGTARQNPLGWRAVVLNVDEVEEAVSKSKWDYLLDLPG